jgi:outer membrane protein TolC
MLIRDNIDSKDIEITEIKVFDYDDVTFNLQDLYEKAVNNRPVIKQLNTEIAALKESKNLIKSDFNPKIYVAAGYSYSNQNDDIEPKGGFFGKLGLNFDLQWNKPSKEISAVSEKIIALNQKRLNTILQIKLEVKDAFENYITARENLKVAKTALKEAEEYFRIVKLKYSNSLASNSDVLDAEAMLTSALNNEKNAYYDLIISYYQIEKTIGNNLR